MGLFDRLKAKSQVDPHLEELRRLYPIMFPGGQAQITDTGEKMFRMLGQRISRSDAAKLYCSAMYLAHTAQDRGKNRIVQYLISRGLGKISEEDASQIFDHLIGPKEIDAASTSLFSEGNGETQETAVAIRTTSSAAGIDAEYTWLEEHFGRKDVDWSVDLRYQGEFEGRAHEVFSIKTATGAYKSIHFDISAFFGRL